MTNQELDRQEQEMKEAKDLLCLRLGQSNGYRTAFYTVTFEGNRYLLDTSTDGWLCFSSVNNPKFCKLVNDFVFDGLVISDVKEIEL